MWAGPYPDRLTRRIAGGRGHLSETNNQPGLALRTVQEGLGDDHPFHLELTFQREISRVWRS